jgi:nucleotide-binding universal stress UspA family protein
MKTIVVATDFSKTALNATNYAVDMALSIQADILLLYVHQAPVVYIDVPMTASEYEMMNDAKKSLSQLQKQLINKTNGKLNIKTEISAGVFFNELKSVCEKIKPYAVVMGSQGTTAAERVFYGGHTIYAMNHLKWPLITVPPGAGFSQIKKICLACDLDEVVESTPIDEIKRLVNDFQAELHVINSGKKEPPRAGTVFESGMLQEMLVSLSPQYHFINNENIDEGIINFVEKNKIDLLIALPKSKGLLKKIVHKSVSKQLILNSHVPVIAMHPIPH